jgi:hypothetical protein
VVHLAKGARKGGLVHLKNTYQYRSPFRELDDEWLGAIEATCNEILGNYMKKKDAALTPAFGAWGKTRLTEFLTRSVLYILIITSMSQAKVRKKKSASKSPLNAPRCLLI